ncbi:MAG: glutamine amidotransferase [Pikeienuella sp.]
MLAIAGTLCLGLCLLAAHLKAPSWLLRGLGFSVLLLALANPALVTEVRRALPDIAVVVIDQSESQSIETRADEASVAEADILAQLDALADTGGDAPLDVRIARVSNDGGPVGDEGTTLITALNKAMADVPTERFAGAVLITDGRAHDLPEVIAEDIYPAPVHALITGRDDEVDRRLTILSAPAFGIVGEDATFRIRADGPAGSAVVRISVDGEPTLETLVRIGQDTELTLPITHGGGNVVEIVLEALPDELTVRNNRAAITVNGVRDRLRVLLISGEPHAGERTWRNLLKADPSVDLVHFTILRPPSKQDGTPTFELSLIAFPTRELFLEKVDEFDLIIFDRYRRRGVLPSPYIANISRYVRDGGAVLISAGPFFAGVESLYRTPLADILPVEPTADVTETPYAPRITEKGERHPVTSGLARYTGAAEGETPNWGRWLRQIDMTTRSGAVIMDGADEKPLLVLDRVGEGRVAVLASDHSWLWSRGYEGGGPQAELLRRLAHWLMKEPELEEEALVATAQGATLTVERRSVETEPEALTIISPSGARSELPFAAVGPGRWRTIFDAEEQGLHRLSDGELASVAAIGPPAPIEFEAPLSTTALLQPLANATGGGVLRLASGVPDVRRVREGRNAEGRGWIGLTKRGAYAVDDVRLTPLAPEWLMLLLASALMIFAWRVEGR